jgi:hypothetical protein
MGFYNPEGRVSFVQISNNALKDVRLSLKAKGLLALMLTFREGWEYYMTQLETLSRDGREAHQSAMKELVDFRYVEKTTKNDPATGKLCGWHYSVTDQPTEPDAQDGKAVKRENRLTVKPSDGKPATNNTNPKNTKNKNTNKDKNMSSGDDARAGKRLPKLEDERYDLGKIYSQPLYTENPTAKPEPQPVTDSVSKTKTAGKATRKIKPKSLEDVPGGAALLKIWNDNCGTLPKTVAASEDRLTALEKILRELGAEAPTLLREAAMEVSKDAWWIEHRYGFDNVADKIVAKAEAWRSRPQGKASAFAESGRVYD